MTSKFAGQDVASWVGIGGVTGKAHVSQPSGGASSGGVAPKERNTAVEDAVRTMQKIMSDLGSQLSSSATAQSVAERLKQEDPNIKITVVDFTKQALSFSRTASSSSSNNTPDDGIWGDNTRKALIAISNFAKQINANVTIQEGQGQSPYRTMKADDLIAMACENINNITKLFNALGISTNVESAATSTGMAIVDMIDPTLPKTGVEDPFGKGWGTRPITLGDLVDFDSFFRFIHGLKPTFPCSLGELESTKPAKRTDSFEEYFEELATEILDNTIVRLSQDAQVPVTPIAEAPKPSDPYCFSVIGDIIDWFSNRANKMFDTLYDAISSPFRKASPRPDRNGKPATTYDAQLGKYYVQQMEKISSFWNDKKDDILNALKENGGYPIVTKKLIDSLSKGTTGKGHRQRGEGEGSDRGRTVQQDQQQAPLARFMSLTNFEDLKVPSLENVKKLSPHRVLPELDLRDWSNGAWTTFAQSDVDGSNDAEKYEKFGPWAAAIRDSLREAYNDWKSYNHNPDELKIQHDWLNRWIAAINGTIGTWNGEYKEQMARARRGL